MRVLVLFLGLIVSGPATAETWHCQPAYPYFCGNIHVGCAERSRVRAQPFSIETGAGVVVSFADGTWWRGTATLSREDHIMRRADSRDWIRIQPNGAYSYRHYPGSHGLMSRGVCTR